jgi:hypothetical protein
MFEITWNDNKYRIKFSREVAVCSKRPPQTFAKAVKSLRMCTTCEIECNPADKKTGSLVGVGETILNPGDDDDPILAEKYALIETLKEPPFADEEFRTMIWHGWLASARQRKWKPRRKSRYQSLSHKETNRLFHEWADKNHLCSPFESKHLSAEEATADYTELFRRGVEKTSFDFYKWLSSIQRKNSVRIIK